jgi:anti-sigma regulatory factor (Ser/Thr protein kinase)
MTNTTPLRLRLSDHEEVLRWVETAPSLDVDLGSVHNVYIWALVALAALAGSASADNRPVRIRLDELTPQTRFAHAVGLNAVIGATSRISASEDGRTVRLRRIRRFDEIEAAASEISRLLLHVQDEEDTRRTLYYILVELIRNAVQHSRDPGGAIVGAQLMDKTREYEPRPMIQVAVGDVGIGVMDSLRSTYPDVSDPHEALVKAQQPWVSSAFEPGLLGGITNAGLGLFFLSEMAKRTAGRFLLASRGGSLLLEGDRTYSEHHSILTEPSGFPGTLMVFELPIREIEDYQALIALIQDLARERIPKITRVHWIRFEPAPRGTFSMVVRVGAEDTAHALRLATEHFLPRVARGEPIELDFARVPACTQSYLHALLFSVLREAYPARADVYVINASPAVAGGLDFLEGYALPP